MEDKNRPGKALNILKNLDVYFSCTCLILLIGITFIGVIFRYIFNKPITWLEEIQLMLLLWIGFVTAGAAFRQGSHIGIEMVVELFPKKVQRVVEWFDRAVVMVILLFLTKQCFEYFLLFVRNGRKTAVLRIPYAAIYVVMPVTCILMIAGFLSHEIKAEKERKQEKKRGEEEG